MLNKPAAVMVAGVAAFTCWGATVGLSGPAVGTLVQVASDTTADVRAQVHGDADAWSWRLEPLGRAGLSTTGTVAETVPRRDTVYRLTFCAAGVNVRDGVQGPPGPETCGSADVPARPIPVPPAPDSVELEVDTVQVAAGPDSVQLFSTDAGARTTVSLQAGTSGGGLVPLAYYGGEPHVCADVQGRAGWWELTSKAPLAIASSLRLLPDDRAACGVTFEVLDSSVATLSDPQPLEIPVQDRTALVGRVAVRGAP
jgi:hypothetical protein